MALRHGNIFFLNLIALSSTLLRPTFSTVDIGVGVGIGIGVGVGDTPPAPDTGCGCPASPPPAQFENEKLRLAYHAIQSFKKTITCDPKGVTATWSGTDPCAYAGFYCSRRSPGDPRNLRTVASVDLNGFSLAAPTIAGLVDALPDLALFHANSNDFAGGVPDLTRLPYLYELDLSNNQLAGPFPAAVLPLANLTFLDLRFNRFVGAIPPEIFVLPTDVVFFNDNALGGPIPATLGASTAMYLTLANNGLTGPIPASIGEAGGTLREVLLLNNKLSGCLPPGIGRLRHARVFDAGGNGITGTIPESLGCLASVEQLSLAGNLLHGDIPEALCLLARVENISLAGNYLTGIGPNGRRLAAAGVLDVKGNCIDGWEGQRSGIECRRFLASAMTCPETEDEPCSLPTAGEDTAGDGSGVPVRGKYRSYSALVGHHLL